VIRRTCVGAATLHTGVIGFGHNDGAVGESAGVQGPVPGNHRDRCSRAGGAVGFVTGDVPLDVGSAVRPFRVFLGPAGWGPGQLEAGLAADAWIVEPAVAEDVFTAELRSRWGGCWSGRARPGTVPYASRSNPA
jgi:hypothetical protein